MYRLSFSLKTLSPIVLSSTSNSTIMTETHTAFGGSIIRGVLATRFVEIQNLGKAAHNDQDFREIFYGNLKFLPATPEIFNQRSFVLPLSLQSGKAGTSDGNKVQDLLDNKDPKKGYKSFRGFGLLQEKGIFTAQVKTNMFMHMSRSGDKERLAGRSIDRQIYNYEAIDAGQNFRGEILGDEKTLNKLLDGLKLDGKQIPAYIGRSRFTQYGKCLLTFGNLEEIKSEPLPNEIFLRLDTPLVPVEDCFLSAKEILQSEVADKLGDKFSIGKVFASCVEIENFVVPWSMKRPRVSALAAGSVFELKIDDNLTDADRKFLSEKIFSGFGMRTEEGFGQMRFWTSANDFTKCKLDDEKISKPEKFSDKTIEFAKKILVARLLEQVRIYAQEDAKELRKQLRQRGNMTHFFSRLGGILSSVDKKNLRENFKAGLELEIRKGSQFEEHLKNLYMSNDQRFFDVFTGNSQLPHEIHDLFNNSVFDKVRAEIDFNEKDFSDDEFFMEYLTNYFRFARKLAATSKGGEVND